MKVLLFISLISLHFSLNAMVQVSTEMEFGISKDDEETNIGIAGNYNLFSEEKLHQTSVDASFQIGSDKGRSLVATSSHQYQYEQSFIQGNIQYQLKIPTTRFTLLAGANHRTQFDIVESQNSTDIDTDFTNTVDSFSFGSGAKYESRYKNWFNYRIQSTVVNKINDGVESDDFYTDVNLWKPINKYSQFGLNTSNNCTKYQKEGLKDTCIENYTINYSLTRKNYLLSVDMGLSKQDGDSEEIYSLTYNYEFNSHFSMNTSISQSLESSQDIEDQTLLITDSEVLRTNSYYVSLVKKDAIKRIEYRLKQEQTSLGDYSIKNRNEAIYYQYYLSKRICSLCFLEATIERYRFVSDEDEQLISSLGLRRINSRQFQTAIIFRKTKQMDLEVNSLNLIISYYPKKIRSKGF